MSEVMSTMLAWKDKIMEIEGGDSVWWIALGHGSTGQPALSVRMMR